MTVTVYWECPKCFAENDVEFDIGEHFCDLSECGECGYELTQTEQIELQGELETQAIENAYDMAEMYYGNR